MNIESYRAAVRPTITLVFTILVALMFWFGKPIPQLLQYTWLAIIAEYFGERLLFKLLGFTGSTNGTPTPKPTK